MGEDALTRDGIEQRTRLDAIVVDYLFQGRAKDDDAAEVEFVVEGDFALSRLMRLAMAKADVFPSIPQGPKGCRAESEGWTDPLRGMRARILWARPHPRASDKAVLRLRLSPPMTVERARLRQAMAAVDALMAEATPVPLSIDACEPPRPKRHECPRRILAPLSLRLDSANDPLLLESDSAKARLAGEAAEKAREAKGDKGRPVTLVLGEPKPSDTEVAKARVWSLDGRGCELASGDGHVQMSICDLSERQVLFLLLAKDQGLPVTVSVRHPKEGR